MSEPVPPRRKKPLITANQVTIMRMALLPVPAAILLYGPPEYHFVSVVLYALLGMTDFVDGQMARHYGPTVLGGLLDPVADKVFMAAAIVPLAAGVRFGETETIIKLVHPAVVAAIFFREFLITSLRSVMSLHGAGVKTSVLGKLKTAIQMVGVGFVFLIARVPKDEDILLILGICSAVAVAVMVWRYAVTRAFNPLVFVPGGLVVLALVVRASLNVDDAITVHWGVIIVFTFASALDYLSGAGIILRSGGRLHSAGRLWWSLVVSGGVTWLLVALPEGAPVWIVITAAELTSGAVDNLRCHEKTPPRLFIYPVRGLAVALGTALILSLPGGAPESAAFNAGIGLALVMSLWTALDFVAARHIIWGEQAVSAQSAQKSVSR